MDIANDLIRAFNDGVSTAQAQMSDEFAKLKRDLKDCRNELCLKRGDYTRRHLGACDGCRWRADNGEYIEREAAIKLFNFAVLDCLGMEPTIRAGDIIKALESIPAADVREVVRGKWEEDCAGAAICSVCGEYAFETSTHHLCGWFPNFCPNCGADMREK